MPSLAACFQAEGETPPSVGLTFDVTPAGKADNIRVQGASPPASACVTARLAALTLPPFKGQPVPVTLPLTLYRPERVAARPTAQPAAVAAAPVPAAAPAAPPSTVPISTLPTKGAPTTATGESAVFVQP